MNSCQHTIGLSVGSYRAQESALKARASPFTMDFQCPLPKWVCTCWRGGGGGRLASGKWAWKAGVLSSECRLSVVWVSNDFDTSHAGGRYAWVGLQLGQSWRGVAGPSCLCDLGREDCDPMAMAFFSLLGLMWAFHSCACPSFWPWSLLQSVSLKSLCTSYALALLSLLRSSSLGSLHAQQLWQPWHTLKGDQGIWNTENISGNSSKAFWHCPAVSSCIGVFHF